MPGGRGGVGMGVGGGRVNFAEHFGQFPSLWSIGAVKDSEHFQHLSGRRGCSCASVGAGWMAVARRTAIAMTIISLTMGISPER
jgi:hypothetical protein